MRQALIALAAAALLRSASGLLLTSGSPCEQYCGNVLTNTTGADMVCDESQYYSKSEGIVFEACIKCQLGSGYSKGNESDLGDMLYNLRYAMSWCIFGDPGNKAVGTNPCITSTACGPLKAAFEYQDFSHDVGSFDYCSANWSDFQMPKCQACLTAAGQNYINNFVTILDAACMQRPAVGSTVSVSNQPFTSTPITITTPSPTPTYVVPVDTSPLSLGAKVGIAIGALALLLFIAGVAIICNGKRKRRAFLRDLEKRHADQGWPHPNAQNYGGQSRGTDGDMFETPVSQRPLVRPGWEESPVSAVPTEQTDRTLPRYFSPYSSQYNSPVSAIEGPSMMNWPTQQQLAQGYVPDHQQAFSPYADQSPQQQHWPSSQQEKLAQLQHEHQQKTENEIQIGLALGGDEASLRSKNSNPHFHQAAAEGHDGQEYTQYGYPVDKKGKDQDYGGSGEEYELREVERHKGNVNHGVPPMPVLPQAPVLHHPGYGRAGNRSRPGSQEEQQHQYGQYSEDDVRRGHVI